MIHRRNIAILFAVIIVSGLSLALLMYSIDRYSLVYYGDAVSHLIGARKLFDLSEDRGCCRVGTVWLPLPHFLLMLPSMINGLFFTGLAGLVVSLPSLALTSFFLYKLVTIMLTKIPTINRHIIPYAAFAGALLYASNSNILYMGVTAMTEAPFMLFFVGSAYYFFRWREEQENSGGSGKGLSYLVAASLFLIAATLSRYEAWILPLLFFPLSISSIILMSRRLGKNSSELTISSVQGPRAGERSSHVAVYVVLAALLSLSGIISWLIYNAAVYGDPLEFANAENYSAASQALNRSFRETLYLQPANVLNVYGVTALMVYGPVLLSAAVVGYLRSGRLRIVGSSVKYIYIFLALPPLFTIIALLAGVGEMGDEMASWLNSRFATLLAPLLASLAALLIVTLPKKITGNHFLLIGVITSLFAFQAVAPAFSDVLTIAEAKAGFQYKQVPYSILTGEKLSSLFDGSGYIMIATGSAQEHRIEFASGIALKNFDSMIEITMQKQSFYEPWSYNDKWIVLAKEPDSDGVRAVNYWKDHRNEIDQRYVLVYENPYYEILALR